MEDYTSRDDVRSFITELAANDGFDARELTDTLRQVRQQPKVLAAMSRPLVSPPKWFEYAPQFLSARRITGGVEFWAANAFILDRAEHQFGVPAEVIVAIIGVETFYGRNTGSYRVVDALATLAFDYPRRAEFFRRELRQFLLMSREQGVSPLAATGSFAGAMGLPQFMPGSFRSYAVDYNTDGRIDLWNAPEDAIGSVGRYLAEHDWRAGQRVDAPIVLTPDASERLAGKLDGGLSERRPLDAWAAEGVDTGALIDISDDPAGLLMLEENNGPRYRFVFHNWYVLTRYNKSRLYASAVWALAKAVKSARERSGEPVAVKRD